MELFTLDRQFVRQKEIDVFHSVIWTERYYGDSEVELSVAPTTEMIQALPLGIFLGLEDSDEIMILESREFEDNVMKLKGVSLLPWLNNRFIRTSALHQDRHWVLNSLRPGEILMEIVKNFCITGPYLDGTIPIGINNPDVFIIPGLSIGVYDKQGDPVSVGVPFGPVFDALYEIATTYLVGQQIVFVNTTGEEFSLQYRNYRGLDRTSDQNFNGQVQFSPDMESLTDIKEIQSIVGHKNRVWAFAPANPDDLAGEPGYDGDMYAGGEGGNGFDLRAEMIFAEDITTDQVAGDAATLWAILNARAADGLANSRPVHIVDGEIVPTAQFQYGIHYSLGDIVELQGTSGILQHARVMEYIRAKDSGGVKTFPTVSII